MDDFLIRALLAGMGVATVSGVLGCFVVWRRMAYFGDSLAHSALLGIALGLLMGVNFNLGVFVVCSLFAFLLVWLQQREVLATDTLLGILAHAALSFGLVAVSLLDRPAFDLDSYLFGDILSVMRQDLWWVAGGGIFVLAVLWRFWSALTLITINEELAKAESVNTFWLNVLLMVLMTIVVAISIRIVGILLITSLLIIPAATARLFARSPEQMALFAALLGCSAVGLGLTASMFWDSPSGPSIVSAAAVLFVLLLPLGRRRG